MIVEERIYTLQPGTSGSFMSIVEKEGFEVQKEILGRPAGYFVTEIGPQNQIVHLWAYRDMEERRERRARLVGDPRWQAVRPKLTALIVSQENKLLLPAKFWPIAE
jgi:NIPSNAP